MKFRTELKPPLPSFVIQYTDPIFCLGSCFAEHIGLRLEDRKFATQLNPFGILYNPVSIAQALERLRSGEPFTASKLFEHQGLWHSFAHHGRFSHPDRDAALSGIHAAFGAARDFLPTATRMMLTFGTAHVFEWKETGEVVANCHKLPGAAFRRRRLRVAEIVYRLAPILEELHRNHPDLRVIATVSPVRHLRDGLIENQRSKATLLLAIAELCEAFDFLYYFPSYELLLDDLRDYRFYAPDLAHPNEQAIAYIWRHFAETFFRQDTLELMATIEKVVAAAHHRPLHPDTPQHQQFVTSQLGKMVALEQKFGFLDFSREKAVLSEKLK